MNSVLKNPRTSFLAVAGFISLFFSALQAELDNDPKTTPDWNQVVTTGFLIGGLLAARDSNKTSEDVGAK